MTDNTTPKPIPRAIAERLQAAQQSATAVAKGSRNDFQSYDYASAEEIIVHVQPLFAENGLGVFRIAWEPVRWLVTPDGEPAHKVRMWFQIIAVGEPDPWMTSVVWPVVANKGRPEDKAEGCALTDGTKYWILGMLMLPRVDVEMDQRDDSSAHGHTSTPPAKRGSKSKPAERTQTDGRI